MKFSKLTKRINTSVYTERIINIDEIKAQYNPERFKFWKFLHKGPEKDILNMIYSPHCRFLNNNNNIETTPYYKLQKLYGRSDKWIRNKIDKFIKLFENIKTEGYKKNIIILQQPLIENEYNKGFEIFEGHHRISCCIVLKIKKIKCKVVSNE